MKLFGHSDSWVGPGLWVLSLQYFVVQLVVAAAWVRPYSWAHNTISDLGNTYCGGYGDRLVCSPRHTLMNASFILLGGTMLSGALLVRKRFSGGRAVTFGFGGLVLGGLGTALIGLFPENTVSDLHILGAALPLVLGNLALVVLGIVLRSLPGLLRMYSAVFGLLALGALGLFLTSHYFGLGIGGMERLAAYPLTVWLISMGVYLLFSDRVSKQ